MESNDGTKIITAANVPNWPTAMTVDERIAYHTARAAKRAPVARTFVTTVKVPSGSKCKHCGWDLRGIYGQDRVGHKEGWCR
jgi:hypothetical protein